MSHNCPNNNRNLSPVRENGEALRGSEQKETMDRLRIMYIYYKKKIMELYEIENSITKDLMIVLLKKTKANFPNMRYIEYEIKNKFILQDVLYNDDKIYTMAKRIYQRIKDICTPDTISHENIMELYKLEKDIIKDFFGLLQVKDLKRKNTMDYLREIKSKIAKETSSKNLLDEKRITNMVLRILQCVSDSIFYDSSCYANLVVLKEEAQQEVYTPKYRDERFDQISNKMCEINSELNQKEMGKLSTENKKLLIIERLKRDIKKDKIDIAEFDDAKIDSMANRAYECLEDLSKVKSIKHRLMQFSLEKNYTHYLLTKLKKTDIRDIHKINNIELIKRELRNEISIKKIPLSDEGLENMTKRIFQRVGDILLCDPSYLKFVKAGSDKTTGGK